MEMEISNAYNSYVSNSAYAVKSNNEKQTARSSETEITSSETSVSTRKTAADELSYLSKKYSGYSFVAGVYQPGTTFGSSNTINIMIDPRFLTKMANDPELEAEYEKQISLCKELDEQMKRSYAAQGWRCECGTIIDKDGGMSGWAIVTKDPNAKSYLQKMSENTEKIRKQSEERKKADAQLEEKRQARKEEKAKLQEEIEESCKEQFGDKFKVMTVMDEEDENVVVSPRAGKNHAEGAGWNLDMKI